MNNREEIKSFLVVFEDENENEYQSSLINKESSLYLLKESIELKYNKSIIDVYYFDLEAVKQTQKQIGHMYPKSNIISIPQYIDINFVKRKRKELEEIYKGE